MRKRNILIAFMTALMFTSTPVYAEKDTGDQTSDTADQAKDENEDIADELNGTDDTTFYSDAMSGDNLSDEAKSYLNKNYDEANGIGADGSGAASGVLQWAEAAAADQRVHYVRGGTGPDGVDCSGFASLACAASGATGFTSGSGIKGYVYSDSDDESDSNSTNDSGDDKKDNSSNKTDDSSESEKKPTETFSASRYTSSNIKEALLASGWKQYTYNNDTYAEDLQPGDVVVAPGQHVTIIDKVEDGVVFDVAARSAKKPHDDQVSVGHFNPTYHDYKWYFRCPETDNGALGSGNNQDKTWNFLCTQSTFPLSKKQVAGVMGNLYAETGGGRNGPWSQGTDIRPDNVSGPSVGICQWLGARKKAMIDYVTKTCGKSSWKDLEGQLKYMLKELKSNEKQAGNYLKAAKTPAEAGGAFSKWFERPAETQTEIECRGKLAEEIYSHYKDKSLTINEAGDGAGGTRVAIDAGHPSDGQGVKGDDGITSGMENTSVGLKEYKYTQEIAERVQKILVDKGYSVLMTRTANKKTNHSNKERAAAANDFKANAYIRIHVNSGMSGNGFWLVDSNKSSYSSEKVYDASQKLDESVAKAYKEATGLEEEEKVVENLNGTNSCKMATCLLETGNGDSNESAKWLLNNRDKVAKGAAQGVINYLGKPKKKAKKSSK